MRKLKDMNLKKVAINVAIAAVIGFCIAKVISIFTDKGVGADGKPYYSGFDDEPVDEHLPEGGTDSEEN